MRSRRAPRSIRRRASRRSAASPPTQVERLARDYGTPGPAAIRVNYGMQRTRRRRQRGARDRLPAGAHRRVAPSGRRRAAVDVGHLPRRRRRAGAPGPDRRRAANDQHVDHRRGADVGRARPCARSSSTTPTRWRSRRSPAKWSGASPATTSSASSTTCSRPTPPTTPTSCCRRPRSSSTSTCTIRTATCTCRRTCRRSRRWARRLPNTEVFRRLAARMGFDDPAFRDDDETLARQALRFGEGRLEGVSWDLLKATGLRAAVGAGPVRAVRRGRLSDAVGQVRVRVGDAGAPRATIRCRRSCRRASRRRRTPSSRAATRSRSCRRRRATSSTRRSPTCPASSRKSRHAWLDVAAADAAARGIADGDRVRIFNDRGSFTATARAQRARAAGCRGRPSIWWRKLSPDGENANAVTGQALTDLGRAATFYDCLVEVARCD